MADIAFIAPYQEIANLARAICGADDREVDFVTARAEAGVAAARAALQAGAIVLISRGLTARLIAEALPDTPLVEIKFSGYDLLRAYLQGRTHHGSLAVVDGPDVVDGVATLEKIMDITDISLKVVLDDSRDYSIGIERAVAQGARCVLGNQAVVQEAVRRGLNGVVIGSGREAVMEALASARQILAIHRLREANTQQIDAIINAVDYGIMSIDNSGTVSAINAEAKRLLGLAGEAADAAQDKFVNNMRRCLTSGERIFGEVVKITPTVQVVINRQPITVRGKVSGAVATLQELQRLQDIEHQTRRELARRGRVARHTFADIVTRSAIMQRVVAQAQRFAMFDATVLILGETGVGKEYFAHAIHRASSRSTGPFVAVNCAAIPDNILESELFGYAEGAFTDARKGGKAGLFEQAHNGTIFLDEIGEMPEKLQTRLLRVLQEHEVYRLGDDRIIPINIRVIAATNRDLSTMVEEKRFRQDLYYRLDMLTLRIPPVRERPEDIAMFIRQFLREFNQKYHTAITDIEPAGMTLLTAYDWPGNIREIYNLVGRLVALATGSVITREEVAYCLQGRLAVGKGQRGLKAAEAAAIRDALAKTGGNKQKAALLLGIGRATLWRKLKKLSSQQP